MPDTINVGEAGGGVPIGSLTEMYTNTETFIEKDGTTWIATGYIEEDLVTYNEAPVTTFNLPYLSRNTQADGVSESRGMCTLGAYLYVATNTTIKRFDKDTLDNMLEMVSGLSPQPRGLAFNGEHFIVIQGNDFIKYDTDFNLVGSPIPTGLTSVNDLDFHDGKYYVANEGDKLSIFDEGFNLLSTITLSLISDTSVYGMTYVNGCIFTMGAGRIARGYSIKSGEYLRIMSIGFSADDTQPWSIYFEKSTNRLYWFGNTTNSLFISKAGTGVRAVQTGGAGANYYMKIK